MRVVSTRIDPRSFLLRIERGGEALSWAAISAGFMDDAALRSALSEALVGVPFAAMYWEARPVAPEDHDAPFECVVLDAPALARATADPTSFLTPLDGARAPAVRSFANLSGDARLVVPAPGEAPGGYPHLAAFLRAAPAVQVHALWVELGRSVGEWLATRRSRVWVSTAGGGVPWLHVRLDSRPKYVKWAAYRTIR